MQRRLLSFFVLSLAVAGFLSECGTGKSAAHAQEAARARETAQDPTSVLTSVQWQAVDGAVDRALAFLATRQQEDGSFAGAGTCQPAITSLAVMSFLSRGHLPGQGPYGDQLDKAVDFVLTTQSEAGLLSYKKAEPYLHQPPNPWEDTRAHALYNHGISGLMLTELYGMTGDLRSERIREAVVKALDFSRQLQTTHKKHRRDYGGWRYMFHFNGIDSDLSVTSWQVTFYRSAMNAGFDVPKQHVNDAMGYVRSCFHADRGRFCYTPVTNEDRCSRGMSGAGILALSLGGEHQTEMAKTAAGSLLKDSFEHYNHSGGYNRDRYHYSVYHCTLGMYQMGGEYWAEYFPAVARTLLKHQRPDGSWDQESVTHALGNTHTTAMMILALTVTNQLIPVYQR